VPKIFINYRRDDSAGYAGRVHDRLETEFGRQNLFMDVDAIPLGSNFAMILRNEVAKCDVLLALIGRGWSVARDDAGARRLDNPADYVRVEIAAALQRDIFVVPVLVDGARMPKAGDLPKDLEDLAFRHGMSLHHDSFHADMGRLIGGIRRSSTPGPTATRGSTAPPPMQERLSENAKAKSPPGRGRQLLSAIAGTAFGMAAVIAVLVAVAATWGDFGAASGAIYRISIIQIVTVAVPLFARSYVLTGRSCLAFAMVACPGFTFVFWLGIFFRDVVFEAYNNTGLILGVVLGGSVFMATIVSLWRLRRRYS
jgi:hypothetical protein